MRYFAADQLERLSVAPSDLPAPWVMPWYFTRTHKNRLVALLARALRHFDDRIGFVELRWAERHLVEERRLRIPRPALIWWRVDDAVPPVDPQGVLRDALSLSPGYMLFDFAGETDLLASAWLGPLKVQVLHRLIDGLLDGRPVEDPQPLVATLSTAAETITSPVELIDFANTLIERSALGLSLEDTCAEAHARVLARRFEPEREDRETADRFIVAFAAAAKGGISPRRRVNYSSAVGS